MYLECIHYSFNRFRSNIVIHQKSKQVPKYSSAGNISGINIHRPCKTSIPSVQKIDKPGLYQRTSRPFPK